MILALLPECRLISFHNDASIDRLLQTLTSVLPQPTVLTTPPVPTNLDRLSASVMEATSCRMDCVLVRYTPMPLPLAVTLTCKCVTLFFRR